MTATSLAAADWLDSAEAALRLGVTPATLRAYGARGLLTLREADGAVLSASLQRLRRRRETPAPCATSPRAPMVARDTPLLVDTALTQIAPDAVWHRGRDAAVLAQSHSLEDMARLLWAAEDDPFSGLAPRPVAMLGADARVRALSFLASRAGVDASIAGRTEAVLVREAAALLSDLADALCGGARGGLIHERLAKTWRLDGVRADAVRQALVLCADDAFDAATLSVRAVAASGAGLAACLLPGAAALSGPAQGGDLHEAALFILEAKRIGDARTAVVERLSRDLPLPGFGHPAHPHGDPRARALALALPWSEDIRELARAAETLGGRAPTLDFALAALGRTLGLPGDAGLAIRLLGRCTGWLGHALEQRRCAAPLHFDARYVGVAPERPKQGASSVTRGVAAEVDAGRAGCADAA